MTAAVEPSIQTDLGAPGAGLRAVALPGPRFSLVRQLAGRSRISSAVASLSLVVATTAAAKWLAWVLGVGPTASTGVILAWLALLFCARTSTSHSAGATILLGRVRPALVLLLLCCVAPMAAGVNSTVSDLVALGFAVVGATATVDLAATGLRLSALGSPGGLVIAGSAAQVAAVVGELERPARPRWRPLAVCVPEEQSSIQFDLPVLVGASIIEVAREHEAAGVLVLPTSGLDAASLRRLSWELERDGREFLLETGLLDVSGRRTTVLQEAGLGLLHVRPAARRGAGRVAKDIADRFAAAALLALLTPVLLAIAIAIRADSRGPALFKQARVGRDGALFTIYKFRTMTTDAESAKRDLGSANETGGVLFKVRADPRITRVGRWLRTYSLDELPQLWNVLVGDMSLVGPRPALPEEVSQYSYDPRRRLVVKPGITGLWQVSGRSDLSWEQTVRLDVRYVDNWSLGLDLVILWRTIGAVLLHRGAY